MRPYRSALILVPMIAAIVACGGSAPAASSSPSPSGETQGLVAEATSSASVRLDWRSVDGAQSYLVEAHYGEGDFLPLTVLPADQTSFVHFTVPGSAAISYRLSANTGAGSEAIGALAVDLPELTANPLVVHPQPFEPSASQTPLLPAFPTLDPSNPDPSAMETAIAAIGESNPEDLLGSMLELPEYPRTEIGPEGGTVTLTDPNGVTFDLTFPARAAAESTAITLIPIESIPEVPFAGGILAGVQAFPPTRFAGPLTLKITLPSSPSAGTPLVAFQVSDPGSEFSLTPVLAEGDGSFSLLVYGGETWGLAAATPEEIEAQAARIPSDPRAQMTQQLAALRAVSLDPGPEDDARIAAQVLQGLSAQIPDLTAATLPGGGAKNAAPAARGVVAPERQYESPQRLIAALFWSEAVWDWLQQMLHLVPGAEPPPGALGEAMRKFEAKIIEDMTTAIKAFMDDHEGCRSGLGVYAESFRQALNRPERPFQSALAAAYRARFGPPPTPQCEFRLQIARSSIKEESLISLPEIGRVIQTWTVHSEPWVLDLDFRGGLPFLRGPVGTIYDAWEIAETKCPPPVQVRPFPSSLIWIADLGFVFDENDTVSDLQLRDVRPDRVGGSLGRGWEDIKLTEGGGCKASARSVGANPADLWGMTFAALHSGPSNLDDWTISGEDSYVATDTVNRVEARGNAQVTENTTIVLTVTRK